MKTKTTCPACADERTPAGEISITPTAASVRPLRTEPPDESPDCEPCPNCGQVSTVEELQPIDDLGQRVAPGEPMPAGECPECGALCHLMAETVSPNGKSLAAMLSAVLACVDQQHNDGRADWSEEETECFNLARVALGGSQPMRVKIEVSGGCAEVTECPESVRVTIIDHDNERDKI